MLNIHIIEDNPQDQKILSGLLFRCGVPVKLSYSSSIQEAIALSNHQDFQCTFLDYQLPDKSGEEFLHYFNSQKKEGFIIVVTSQDNLQTAVDCMRLGAVDFILKSDLNVTNLTKSLNYINLLKKAQKDVIKAQEALHATESKLQQIISRSPVLVFELDTDGKIILCRGELSLLGTKASFAVEGKLLQETGDDLPVRQNDFIKASKNEAYLFRISIDEHFFDVNYIPFFESETGILTSMTVVVVDVTDFMLQEQQLQNELEHKELASKLKEHFLATVSHEIRTPIHGIISLVQFLRNTSLCHEQENYLRLIQKSADTLLVIVNDILDLSKLNADKMVFEEIPFNLNDTIQLVISTFLPKAIEKSITLRNEQKGELPEKVIGDPVRLTQILNNLISNALKFTEKGEVIVFTEMKMNNGSAVIIQFQIRDTGIGIPANKVETIFESFSQAGSDTSRLYGGTGLGLSITKQLINRLGGNIHVRSILKTGTTFTVDLPYTICAGNSQCDKVTYKMNQKLNEKIKILVAEDHDVNRFIIAKMMKDWQIECDFAANGRAAVDYACKNSYDVILMDVEMPDMNGYQATETIRKSNQSKNQNTPIIAMTGHALVGEKEKCLAVGMNEYLSKPFKSDELRLKITEKALENKTNMRMDSKDDILAQNNMSNEAIKVTQLDFLKEISDNNEVFYFEFIQMFLRNCPESLQEIKEGIQSHDWEKIRQAAHKAKPSFNYVGMKECSIRTAKIEECARNKGQLSTIQEHFTFIEQQSLLAFIELSLELKSAKHHQ